MPFKAWNDNILVKEIKETKVSGGIVIPNSSKEFTKGEIVYAPDTAIGPDGVKLDKGNIVVYNRSDANNIEIDGVDLKLLKLKDIVVSD